MELLVALAYFLLVGLSGQALWSRLLGKKVGQAFAIPLTLSALVIVGSPVLSTGLATAWPAMLGVIVGTGWIANLSVVWKSRAALRLPRPTALRVLLILMAATAIIVSSYSDAIAHLGPAQIDTIGHMENLRTLQSGPLLTFYPVGHYALLQPLSFLVSEQTMYRFVGPAFGVLLAIGFYLIAKLFLASSWALAAVALLGSAAMNTFSLVRSSLLPSALSLLLILALVALAVLFADVDARGTRGGPLILFLPFTLFVVALGLAVPYSLFSFVFAFGLWLAVATAVGWMKLRWSAPLLLIAATGPGLWPLFRTLRGDFSIAGTSIAGTGASIISSLGDAVPAAPLAGGFSNSVGSIILELFRVEGIRDPLESVLSLGAYLVIAGAIAALFIGWRRSLIPLTTVAFLALAYGIFTQTGFSELLTYRGRAGWYLFMLSALLVVLFLVELVDYSQLAPRIKRLWRLLPAVAAALSMISLALVPPSAQRVYKEATFVGIQFVAEVLRPGGDRFDVVSDVTELSFLDYVDSVTSWAEVDGCPADADVAVLDFSPRPSEGFFFEAAVAGEDVRVFEEQEQERVRDLALRARELDANLDACGFESVFSDDDVAVYVHA